MKKTFTHRKSAELFKIFTEEVRLKIIHSLLEKEMCVNDLVEELGMTQPLISHHLKILKNAGLVDSKRVGHRIYYSLYSEIKKNIYKKDRGTLDLGCCEIKFKN